MKKEHRTLSFDQVRELVRDRGDEAYYWDSSRERVTKGAPNSETINSYLDNEKARANKILLKFELMNRPITVELFKRSFLKPEGNNSFEQYFTEVIDKRKHLLSPVVNSI